MRYQQLNQAETIEEVIQYELDKSDMEFNRELIMRHQYEFKERRDLVDLESKLETCKKNSTILQADIGKNKKDFEQQHVELSELEKRLLHNEQLLTELKQQEEQLTAERQQL